MEDKLCDLKASVEVKRTMLIASEKEIEDLKAANAVLKRKLNAQEHSTDKYKGMVAR